MNLSHVTLEGQDDDTFHLKDKTGSFKVMKKHISPHLLDRIHQHFAEGGEVKEETKAVKDIEKVDEDVAKSDADAAPTPAVPPAGSGGLFAKAAGIAGMPVFTALSGGMASAPLGNALTNYANTHGGGLDNSDLKPEAPPSAQALPPPGTPAPLPPPAAVVPPPQRPVGGPGVGAETKAINADVKAESNLAAVQAKRDEEKAAADLKTQQAVDAQRAAIAQDGAVQQKKNQDNQAKLEADTAADKIDSHHWWSSRTTGQKISGVIGLILGGLGTWNGGPNVGLQIIQKAISDDIEDQKANLHKKETQIGRYMQQGHSLQEATQLALANHEAVAAGLFKQNADRYAALPSAPVAAAAAAKLSASGYERINKTIAEKTKVRLDQAQIAHLNAEAEKAQADAAKERAGKVIGKQIADTETVKLKNIEAGIKELDNYRNQFKDASGLGPSGGRLMDVRKNIAPVVAEAEAPGARLQSALIDKAETELPDRWTRDSRGLAAIDNKRKVLTDQYANLVEGLKKEGFNTEAFNPERFTNTGGESVPVIPPGGGAARMIPKSQVSAALRAGGKLVGG